jgi:hypothetical protein
MAKCPAPEVHSLGEVVVAFGRLEFFLEVSIWQLLAPDESSERFLMAQAITAEMSFDRKVHAFASMFRQKGLATADEELTSLIKKLFAVQDQRNRLLHSVWSYSQQLGGSFLGMKAAAKAKHGLKRRFQRMTPDRIKHIQKAIGDASQSLADFTMKYIKRQVRSRARSRVRRA